MDSSLANAVSRETEPPYQGITKTLGKALTDLHAERIKLESGNPDNHAARVLDNLLWRLDMALRDIRTLQSPGPVAPPMNPVTQAMADAKFQDD